VLNNPLNATDPSGYWSFKKAFKKLTHAVGRAVKAVVKAHVDVVAGVSGYTYMKHHPQQAGVALGIGCTLAPGGPAGYGACVGLGSATIARSQGESVAVSLRIGAVNGVVAGGSAVASGQIGDVGNSYARVGLHGVRGGVSSVALGGDFRSGFVSGAFADAAAPYSGNIVGAAIVGGVSSRISGGSFAQGAVISVIGYQFNYSQHLERSNNSEAGQFHPFVDIGTPTMSMAEAKTIIALSEMFPGKCITCVLVIGDSIRPLSSDGATTRVGTIYYTGSRSRFFDGAFGNPTFVMHEYYHVLEQWNTGRLSVPVYGGAILLHGTTAESGNPYEVEAENFGKANWGRFRDVYRGL
jgi:hypothetical protein